MRHDRSPRPSRRAPVPLVCFAALAALLHLACASDRLTREQVAALLARDSAAQPLVITLRRSYRESLAQAGDTPERKEAFRLEMFLSNHPDLGVLAYRGLVRFGTSEHAHPEAVTSTCTVTTTLTEQGRAAARRWTETDAGWTIPLARREVVEVTGVAGGEGADAQQATAEYVWRWAATEDGREFDRSAAEYQSLPAEVRARFGGGSLMSRIGQLSQPVLFDSGQRNEAAARLRRYDDGWRVQGR